MRSQNFSWKLRPHRYRALDSNAPWWCLCCMVLASVDSEGHQRAWGPEEWLCLKVISILAIMAIEGTMMITLWWTYKKLLNMAIEIVDFPINSMVIFHCYVSSPEGNRWNGVAYFQTTPSLLEPFLISLICFDRVRPRENWVSPLSRSWVTPIGCFWGWMPTSQTISFYSRSSTLCVSQGR